MRRSFPLLLIVILNLKTSGDKIESFEERKVDFFSLYQTLVLDTHFRGSFSCLWLTLWWYRPAPGEFRRTSFITEYQVSTWVLTITRLRAAFPDTITEVVCQNPGRDCAGSQFKCRQMRTKMEVVYVELNQSSGPGVLNTAIVREDSGK